MAEIIEAPTKAEAPQFVGGEIHIIANPVDGSIRVNAPANLIEAFGLLEMAKVILLDSHNKKQSNKPQIVPANQGDLENLTRKPS